MNENTDTATEKENQEEEITTEKSEESTETEITTETATTADMVVEITTEPTSGAETFHQESQKKV